MPVYMYRREDGTTFDIRQSFNDSALTVDPVTGQRVQRVMQAAGVIFKGSGFYVNDSKGSKTSVSSASKPSETKTETKSDGNGKESAPAASTETTKPEKASTSTPAASAAD